MHLKVIPAKVRIGMSVRIPTKSFGQENFKYVLDMGAQSFHYLFRSTQIASSTRQSTVTALPFSDLAEPRLLRMLLQPFSSRMRRNHSH